MFYSELDACINESMYEIHSIRDLIRQTENGHPPDKRGKKRYI